MSNANDFVIENGVLKEYHGPGKNYIPGEFVEILVEIPDGVTAIEKSVFWSFFGITDVVIPDSVKEIGEYTFQNCQSLRSVVLPKGLKVIPRSMFSDCRNLEKVVMPDELEEIRQNAFWKCTSISEIKLPKTMRAIGAGAFFGCRNLDNVVIPAGITELPRLVFRDTNLQYIRIPGAVKSIGDEAFYNCVNLKTVDIDEGVTSLGANCFDSCSYLNPVRLPESVTTVGNNAFNYCASLRDFYAPGVEVPNLVSADLKVLAMKGFLAEPERYKKPEVVASYHKQLFTQKKKWLPFIFREDNVKILTLFAEAKKITLSNFEEEFMNLASEANASQCVAYLLDWRNKSQAGKPTRKVSANTLDKDPYNVGDMKKLWLYQSLEDGTLEITCYKGTETRVDIPPRIGKNTVSRLGAMVFSPSRDRRTKVQASQMQKITSISIPACVTDIDSTFVIGCIGLTELTVETENPIYHAEGNCLIETATKTLVAGCKTSIIPDDGSVIAIGDMAFKECTGMTALTIPQGIHKLGIQCFAYTGLTAVEIPKGVEKIPDFCFDHCRELKEIVIPESVTEIGNNGIYACMKLKEIHVPASVTKIGEFVFSKATIYGAAGSCAERYAKENMKKFIAE